MAHQTTPGPSTRTGRRPRRGPRATATALVLALVAGALAVAGAVAAPVGASASAAADPCGPGGNKITCENSKPGTDPEIWDDFWGAGADSIQGFATEISVNVGQRVDFKIDTDASDYDITIYRTGWYGGDGARRIAAVEPSAPLPQRQPQCITDVTTELYDCGNWGVSASWDVPSTAVSGVYLAHLQRRDTGESSHITFIVRDDASTSQVVFQTSDPTWHAYNTYGGSDFYRGAGNGRAYKVSYNRPFLTRGDASGRDFYFGNEYPMVRFLERNGYDVSYISGVDTDRRGHLLTNHDVFLSVGHDEYWSGAQRANVEAARDAGVHLQFLSGNEVYWKTRYEPSADSSRQPYRTLVSYKETWGNAKIDPDPEWTGTWRDPRFAPRSRGGGLPENALVGTAYVSNFSDLPLTVDAREGRMRLWRHTELATLPAGTSRELAPHTVGYESNEDLDNGFRPEGLVRLSTTTGEVPQYLQDFGTTVRPGTTKHHVTLYRAPSGALVFSAGTIQWSWGLDEVHDSGYAPEPADPRMQQAQVNLFADMGVLPATLQAGLVLPTEAPDTAKPVVQITSPAAGTQQRNGSAVTVSGTATDTGGRVAGVEVSADGGQTWRPARGTDSWTHTFIQPGRGNTEVLVRAIDDSANIGEPARRSFAVSCPCSLLGDVTPPTPSTDDAQAVELGLRFTPVVDGFATGVRFYKGTGNGGTHVGSLWSSTGERLAQVTFTGETATGWQVASFGSAVPLAAGQTYTVSYTAPQGRYASEAWAFAYRGLEAGGLRAEGGFGAAAAGVYGAPGTIPRSSYQKANYFVDVQFSTTDDSPLIAMFQTPSPDSSGVPATTPVSARFSKPVSASSVGLSLVDQEGTAVAGATTYDATTRTVTFTPDEPLAGYVKYTATVTGTDAEGAEVSKGGTWSFTTAKPPNPPGVCPCSLFSDETVPTLLEDSDTVPVTLGVRFSSTSNGQIHGIRFYKGPNNVGTHTGSLWTANGVELATGTFTGETASGWQQLTFAEPVNIRKNTTYVASYRAPNGRYSATPNAFALEDLSWDPLVVTSQSGAYTYASGFPGSTSATSYLVDVVFEKTPPSIAVRSQSPAPGATDVPRKSQVSVELTAPIVAGHALRVRHGDTVLPGAATLSEDRTTLRWSSSEILPADADLTVGLTGVVSEDGAALPDQSWTFRTRAVESSDSQTMFGDEIPVVESADDGAPVELGTAFVPARDGFVTAVRFFKGPGNDGLHTGSVWTAGGTRLATVTFTDETARGWQTAVLAEPLAVTAGTQYVVSYHAPRGHYAVTSGFFASPWQDGDLTAPATNNGRYLYGAGGFPGYSFAAANYFVDVVFRRGPAVLGVVERSPADGTAGAPLDARPTLRVSAPLDAGWAMSASVGGADVPATAALSADGQELVLTPDGPLPGGAEVTVTVTGLRSVEGATLPTQVWSFRTSDREPGSVSLLDGVVPATAAADDTSPIELGLQVRPSVDGEITAVRFYKGPGNGGTHTGSVWSEGGVRLGTVTFTGETQAGWQTARFAEPVPVRAGSTYTVSYYAPQGRYAASPGFFAGDLTEGPLTAPGGQNGRYRYGSGGGFPTGSWNSTNYFVDLEFRPTP